MLNERKIKLPTVQFAAAQQYVDLLRSVPTSRLQFRLSGAIRVDDAAPAGDGTVIDDQIIRLLEFVTLSWDDVPIVDRIPGRDLYGIYRRQVAQLPTQTAIVDTDLDAQGNTSFELHFSLYFADPMLARAWDTHLPPLPVTSQLRLYVDWEQREPTGAGTSEAGTGAIVLSGADDYQFSTDPTLEIWQVTHPRQGDVPLFLPQITQFSSQTWTAAQAAQVERFSSQRSFYFQLLRTGYGGDEQLQTAINNLSLLATGATWYDDLTIEMLLAEEAQLFEAVNEETGYLGLRYASGGRLTHRVDPTQHDDLRYEFDLDAPTSDPGIIRVTSRNVVRVRGVTKQTPG